jgi:hypothetical protein
MRQIGFNDLVRTALGKPVFGGDFGVVIMIRVLVGLLVVGGRRWSICSVPRQTLCCTVSRSSEPSATTTRIGERFRVTT